MPRPKIARRSSRVSITLDETDYAEVCAVARENDTSAAWVVRRAISDWLDRRRQRPEPQLALQQKTPR